MANATTLVSRATAWAPSRLPVTVAATLRIAGGCTIQVVSVCSLSTSGASAKRVCCQTQPVAARFVIGGYVLAVVALDGCLAVRALD